MHNLLKHGEMAGGPGLIILVEKLMALAQVLQNATTRLLNWNYGMIFLGKFQIANELKFLI